MADLKAFTIKQRTCNEYRSEEAISIAEEMLLKPPAFYLIVKLGLGSFSQNIFVLVL